MKGFFAGLGVVAGTLLVGTGIWLLRKPAAASISLIGGADGPTSIYVAGKISPFMALFLVGAGVLAVLLGAYVYCKRK